MLSRDDSGQIQTIEAFISAIILVTVLVVVVQATSVTPLTTSFTNQHVKYELQNMGQDVLSALDEMPSLPPALAIDTTPSKLEKSIRDWLEGDYGTLPVGDPYAPHGDWYTYDGAGYFRSATSSHYHSPTTDLEKALTFSFSGSAIAYNVEVRYPDASGKVYSSKMVWNGDPSDNCMTISRYIALHDPVDPGNPGYADLSSPGGLIPDISPDTTLHNVVEIRLTLWVM